MDPAVMQAQLIDCIIHLSAPGTMGGTGVLTAPGLAITCAHVVDGHDDRPMVVQWQGHEYPGQVLAQLPPRPAAGDRYPYPDLALVAVAGIGDHPCAWLDDDLPHIEDRVHVRGYTRTLGIGSEPANFTYEGQHEVGGSHLLKLGPGGQVVKGMSGGPLLNLRTGRVCGLLKATRDSWLPHGGWGVPVTAVRASFPDMVKAHDAYHSAHWERIRQTFCCGGIEDVGGRRLPARLRAAPSLLLRPEYAVVPFRGRTTLLQELLAWCGEPEAWSIRLVHGQGGQGKTRLARELCSGASRNGLLTGVLAPDVTNRQLAHIAASPLPLLIVVDYAEGRGDVVQRVADNVVALRQTRFPDRVLLLARSAGEWWEDLAVRAASLEALLDPTPLSLPPLAPDLDGRVKAYEEAAIAFAKELNEEVERAAIPDLSDPAFDSALWLHMTALAAVLDRNPDSELTRSPSRRLLDHESRYWQRTADGAGLAVRAAPVLRRVVAAATLCPASGEQDGARILSGVPDLADKDIATLRQFARWLHDLYPASVAYYAPLQPDQLGEDLVARVVAETPDLLGSLLGTVDNDRVVNALTVLDRAQGRHEALRPLLADAIARHTEWLSAPAITVALRSARPQLLADAVDHALLRSTPLLQISIEQLIPERSVTLAPLGINLLESIVAADPPDLGPADRGALLNNLALRLARVGRQPEALQAIEKSVSMYRSLVDEHADRYRLELAITLTNLANQHALVGARADALAAAREAAAIHRDLARTQTKYRASLGATLNTLAARLADARSPAEALAAAEEAVTIYRGLANDNADAFGPDLAATLNTLSERLAERGRAEDALASAREATEIYRDLTVHSLDAFGSDLATILGTLSERLAEKGDKEASLAAAAESVDTYRRIIRGTSDAFHPGFAAALQALSEKLAAIGDQLGSLVAAEEATNVFQRLADQAPIFKRHLAASLVHLAVRRRSIGATEEALNELQLACRHYEALSQSAPEEFAQILQYSLGLLADFLAATGRHDESDGVRRRAEEIVMHVASEAIDVGDILLRTTPDTLTKLIRPEPLHIADSLPSSAD